jgi:hypothetical protein
MSKYNQVLLRESIWGYHITYTDSGSGRFVIWMVEDEDGYGISMTLDVAKVRARNWVERHRKKK